MCVFLYLSFLSYISLSLSLNLHITRPHTGHDHVGVKFVERACGISIMRGGQAMEAGLRECLKTVRIGHVLIQHSKEEGGKGEPTLFFCHLPAGIEGRRVLLMDPVLGRIRTIFYLLLLVFRFVFLFSPLCIHAMHLLLTFADVYRLWQND